MVTALGHAAHGIITYIGGMAILSVSTLACMVKKPSRSRWKWVRVHMVDAGVNSLIIVSVILFMIGMVIAFQTAYQLRSVGTEILIPDLMVVSMTRELGPMMTALVVAGRAGASMTAEIGTMRVTEQVDALKVMSVSPVEHLVLTRFLAMIVMLPLLTIYGDVLGIVGGYWVCLSRLGIAHQQFVDHAWAALTMSDVVSGLAKSVIFGAIIAIVACFEGLKVSGGAKGVGTATMRTVVAAFLFIVLADFIFTAFLYVNN